MQVQDYIADNALSAAKEAFRYAKAVPADKLEWSPQDAGQTVISMCRELAMTPTWGYDTIAGQPDSFNEADMEAQRAAMKTWNTVEECENQFNERYDKWQKLVREMPEEDFAKTKWLPYEGGRDYTNLEMLDYVRWNCTYHLGQIAYIQILFGDKEMH